MYDEFFVDSRVSFSDEPPNVEMSWRAYTKRETFSTKVWTDAFLAAFASTAGFDLVTFDKGFAQYADLRFTILS